MKDKDFEEMGQRLYDMEADPPKDGWKRVAGALTTPPAAKGKTAFLRKHWWKPLVVLIPLGVYLVLPTEQNPRKITVNSNDAPVETPHTDPSQVAQAEDRADTTIEPIKDPVTNGSSTAETRALETPENSKKKTTPAQINARSGAESIVVQKSKSSADSGNTTTQAETTTGLSAQSGGSPIERPVDGALKGNNGNTKDIAVGIAPLAEPRVTPDQQPGEKANAKTTSETKELQHSNGQDQRAAEQKHVAVVPSQDDKVTESKAAQETAPTQPIGVHTDPVANMSKGKSNAADYKSDSTREESENFAVTEEKQGTGVKKEPEADERLNHPWRATMSVMPQYFTKSVEPLPDDEILMISKNQKAFYREQLGIGIAAGIGRAITDNFYLDAQLSYQHAVQEIAYSYSNGYVDTLIATLQNDGSILVTPIYELANKEITAKYSYAGLRLGATYYFAERAGGRFNITLTGAGNVLLKADVRQSTDGIRTPVSNEFLNKTNYSISLAGGYNFRFTRGWELMINPMITWFPAQERIQNLPFNFQQKSYGVNFMVSKQLVFKK